jgi:hypothetical protein
MPEMLAQTFAYRLQKVTLDEQKHAQERKLKNGKWTIPASQINLKSEIRNFKMDCSRGRIRQWLSQPNRTRDCTVRYNLVDAQNGVLLG